MASSTPTRTDKTGSPERPWLVGLVSVIVCSVCAWIAYQTAFARLSANQVEAASAGLSALSTSVSSLLGRHESLPRILAMDPRVVAVLDHPDAATARAANIYLENVAAKGGLLAAYVIDANALTVSSSNWKTPTSFVGQSYAFRPYFRDALAQGFGRFYAMGTTSGEPGYFLASAVKSGERVVGVVVVKVDLTHLQTAAIKAGEATAIADEFGVVFLTSEPSLLYRPLHPLSAQALAALERTSRYGLRKFEPLQTRPMSSRVSDVSVTLAGRKHPVRLITQAAGDNLGWQLVSLVDTSAIEFAANSAAVGGAVTGGLFIALLLYADLRRKQSAERARARHQILLSEARLRAVANNLPVMVCFLDTALRYVFANGLYAQMYDTTPERIEGMPVRDLLGPEEYSLVLPQLQRALAGETVVFERVYGKQRQFRCFEATYQPEWSSDRRAVTGVHVMTQDVTETRRQLDDLSRLAQLDHLSGLLNRKGFEARLSFTVDECARQGKRMALLFIDLDEFKPVNDRLGHAAGDTVLKAFSKRLARSVRANDAVARLGGDEFAVIVADIAGPEVAERLASTILGIARTPFDVDGQSVVIGASVGVAYQDGAGASEADICRCADDGLYAAKRAGRNVFRLAAVTPSAG